MFDVWAWVFTHTITFERVSCLLSASSLYPHSLLCLRVIRRNACAFEFLCSACTHFKLITTWSYRTVLKGLESSILEYTVTVQIWSDIFTVFGLWSALRLLRVLYLLLFLNTYTYDLIWPWCGLWSRDRLFKFLPLGQSVIEISNNAHFQYCIFMIFCANTRMVAGSNTS